MIYLMFKQTSEPAAHSGRSGQGKAALSGFMSAEQLLMSWSSQNFKANFQIDIIFINKPQI